MFSTPNFTFLFLLIFLISFFPSAFNYILFLPFRPFIPSKPAGPPVPTCACIPPPDFALVPLSSLASPTTTPPSLDSSPGTMSFFQKTITLPSKSRGSYLITDHIETQIPEIQNFKVGILHLFMQHTSAALSLNENYDKNVRADMSDALDRIVPSDPEGRNGKGLYRHDEEGEDDMPAHIKSALIGASVSVPITEGRLATGTWQGIWYLEFRASRHSRRVVATIQGEKARGEGQSEGGAR